MLNFSDGFYPSDECVSSKNSMIHYSGNVRGKDFYIVEHNIISNTYRYFKGSGTYMTSWKARELHEYKTADILNFRKS